MKILSNLYCYVDCSLWNILIISCTVLELLFVFMWHLRLYINHFHLVQLLNCGMWWPLPASWPCSAWWLPADTHPGSQQVLAQIPATPMGDADRIPGCWLQPTCLSMPLEVHLGNESTTGRFSSYSAFQINKYFERILPKSQKDKLKCCVFSLF